MQYRLATKEDLPQICRLVKSAIEHMQNQGIDQWDELYPTAKDFENDINQNALYAAVDGDKIIGVYVINQDCDEEYHACTWQNPSQTACILHRLCLLPDYQHKGMGSEILSQIHAQAKSMGYSSIRLDVFSKNNRALKLYEKHGYQRRGSAHWRKGLFFIMEKTLP